jgi:tRNA A37 threonylcarbamoyladenosine dehydratase
VDRKRSFILKKEGLDKLHNANVLIVGLGGGIFAAEFWLEQELNDDCRWRRG